LHNLFKISNYHTLCLIAIVFSFQTELIAQSNNYYSIIVAGHAYGSHTGINIGLHPIFLERLNSEFDSTLSFFVLTGDIVNNSTEESWQQVETEMEFFSLPYYYVMGNHDNNSIGYNVFNQKFGNDYYAFDHGKDRFIILNSTEQDRSISANQFEFLKNEMAKDGEIENVFIFFHEVLWNSHKKYKGVKSNSRSRYNQMVNYSNYWSDIHPFLEQQSNKNIFVIAGDVAGNTDAVPAFYDQWDHITLIASGMGEVEDENYLKIKIYENSNVELCLIPLNKTVAIKELSFYAVPEKPIGILGDIQVLPSLNSYEYSVDNVNNAETYSWELPEYALGYSTSNVISVDFDSLFISGDIKVRAFSEGFGYSDAATLSISANLNSIRRKYFKAWPLADDIQILSEIDCIKIVSCREQSISINIVDLSGKIIYKENLQIKESESKQINFNCLPNGVLIISIANKTQVLIRKIFMN